MYNVFRYFIAIIKLDFKNIPVVNRSHMQNYEMI